ncbi:hypothetical protein BpHYR1_042042 [Brachionus plicatilis]|uniref:Uncharacterized protein n=1 Tax=Brachionus plicatilis TaxID=10195 RepID=A0A3M7PTR8_BRAPC|nr:hypothetical protein BpHYR1_042042 [Brachionus plicatilis]
MSIDVDVYIYLTDIIFLILEIIDDMNEQEDLSDNNFWKTQTTFEWLFGMIIKKIKIFDKY